MRLKKLLQGIIPDDILHYIPNQVTCIGDIAILNVPHFCENYYPYIIEAILSDKQYIKTIVNKTAKVSGEKRIASFQFLYGSDTITCHKEAGYSYELDITQVFFNPRLCSEHIRIANQVRNGEQILIPFSGIGPFAIPAAAKGANIVAVEINPYACLYLQKNARFNQVIDRIEIIRGDGNTISSMMKMKFDRIIIPAPYDKEEILFSLLPLLKPNGMIYIYLFKKKEQMPDIVYQYKEKGLLIHRMRRCGNVAPGVKRWVIDCISTSSDNKNAH